MAPKIFKSSKGEISTLLILGVIILGALAFVGGFFPSKRKPPPVNPETVVLKDAPESGSQNNLQLKAPIVVTPTSAPKPTRPPFVPIPTPISMCNHDNGHPTDPSCSCNSFSISVKYRCQNKKCAELISQGNTIFPPNDCNLAVLTPAPIDITRETLDFWCSNAARSGDPDGSTYCNWKPIIYLYPTKPTLVNVSVETSGEIVVSDPLYPADGWKNVLAFPDGILKYNGQTYRELFYETNLKSVKQPETGIVLKSQDIKKNLESLTKQLGLISNEQKELVDFWVPKLSKLNSDYMLISLVDRKEKDKTDKVNINPKPDTMIDFNFYFKPLDKPIDIKPLNLPSTPKRVGFTAVEWGGTIDYGK